MGNTEMGSGNSYWIILVDLTAEAKPTKNIKQN